MTVQPRGAELQGLKALVAVLGVLVVLGTVLVIGIVIHRLYARPAPASIITAPDIPGLPDTAPLLPAIPYRLSQGEHINGIAAAGGAIAIWLNGPEGDTLLLLDPATGKTTIALRGGGSK